MSAVGYDKASVQSIFTFAAKLTGKCLAEVTKLPAEVINGRDRGDLGSLIEQYYFKHLPPNTHEPDFAEAGLELKTTGVVRYVKGGYRAKERLTLTMINYQSLVSEEWENSAVYRKCRLMLILFYLYSKDTPVHLRRFVLNPMLYKIPDKDSEIIKRDWEFIRSKVRDGKAHELSEGDTFYLGACRKGSGGKAERLQRQPFSTVRAKTRAFSFKQSYLNSLIAGHAEQAEILQVGDFRSLEQVVASKLEPFFGRTVEDICHQVHFNPSQKNYKSLKADIVRRILVDDVQGSRKEPPEIVELSKSDVEIKTVTTSSSGLPREHMSFPGFKFLDLLEESWEESIFCEKLEKKFLLIVFQRDENGVERLMKAGFWNMPYADRQEAKRVWEETKRRVSIDATDLPSVRESYVAHVRPKARNKDDKIPTPQGTMHVKQCFWLNRNYLWQVISSI